MNPCFQGDGNAGASNVYVAYGHLFETKQPYTIAPRSKRPFFPTMRDAQGRLGGGGGSVFAPSGSYSSYPWAAFHSQGVSKAMGYY